MSFYEIINDDEKEELLNINEGDSYDYDDYVQYPIFDTYELGVLYIEKNIIDFSADEDDIFIVSSLDGRYYLFKLYKKSRDNREFYAVEISHKDASDLNSKNIYHKIIPLFNSKSDVYHISKHEKTNSDIFDDCEIVHDLPDDFLPDDYDDGEQ